MIKNTEPLSMAEASGHLAKDESGKEIGAFIKKFASLKPGEAKELGEKLSSLDLVKLNKNHICKIVDFLPGNGEDLNKVVSDANLDEDESKKVLDTVKEFK